MIKLIITQSQQQFDMSDFVVSVKWSGRKGSPARQINVSLINNVRAWDDIGLEWEILKGLRCEFTWNDEVLFKGLITDTSESSNAAMSFTAYDYGIYLSNSKNTFTYSKKTLSEIVIDCCQRAGVLFDVITKTDYKIPDITKPSATYWDSIQAAMQATKRKTGKTYFIQFSDNRCHLFERRDRMLQWVLATGENITDYTYTNSIQQTKTRIKLIDSKQSVTVMKNDAELEKAIGTFQDVQQPDDGNTKKELEECAKRLLNVEKVPQRVLSLSAYGITEAISGYCVYVMIDKLNWGRSFFIDEDSHTFKGNTHTMQLKINLCGDEISNDVSDIMSDYKKETTNKSKSSSKASDRATAVIKTARKLKGKIRYVWGGNNPNSGMDCSHFVCWAFNNCGYSNILKSKGYGTAATIYSWSKHVSVSDRQPGDIVFFNNGKYNHIGIYTGNGKMIHCNGSTNGVAENNVSSGGHLVGYGRVW